MDYLHGMFDRKGSIADGKDSDLAVLDGENRVDMVFCRGRMLKNKYKRDAAASPRRPG